jgi:hypothetical protein
MQERAAEANKKHLVPRAIMFITKTMFWKYLHVQVITPLLTLSFVTAMLSMCGMAQKGSQSMLACAQSVAHESVNHAVQKPSNL